MSEFTEKLNSSELVSNAWDEIDKDQASAWLLIDVIKSEFKDWQPPKPLVAVPEDVDKAIKYLKTQNNFATITDLKKLDILTEKGFWWLNDFQFKDRRFGFGGLNNKLFILSHLAITGYQVEKEQLYCLKHIDLSDTSKSDVDYFLCDIDGSLGHLWETKGSLPEIEHAHFIQSEIDKLHIGSYEQIEVGE